MTDQDVKKDSIETELLLTKAEAIALVKRSERDKGSCWRVMIPLDAAVLGDEGRHFPLGCYTSLNISKADAVKVFESMAVDVLEHKGARIRVRKTESFGGYLGDRTQYMIH